MSVKLDINKIKMIISDFDGVFTDCTGFVDFDGNMSKKIHFHDVMAIALAIRNGIKFVIITGEEAGAVKYLDRKFKQLEVYQDIKIKIPLVKQILEENNLSNDEVVYIGDDVNDFESLSFVKNPITVPNAHFVIKNIPNIQITDTSGGNGVIREVVDALILEKENFLTIGETKR